MHRPIVRENCTGFRWKKYIFQVWDMIFSVFSVFFFIFINFISLPGIYICPHQFFHRAKDVSFSCPLCHAFCHWSCYSIIYNEINITHLMIQAWDSRQIILLGYIIRIWTKLLVPEKAAWTIFSVQSCSGSLTQLWGIQSAALPFKMALLENNWKNIS